MKKLFLMILMVSAASALSAQRTPIKTADLQKSITDNISRDYAGFSISQATKVMANNTTSYEVVISKGTTTETLLYDKDGKFVKKISSAGGSTHKPGPSATSQNKSATNTTKTQNKK